MKLPKLTSRQREALRTKAPSNAPSKASIPFPQWCELHGLPVPVKEHRFHPARRWRFDWAWPDQKVAVEIHGSVWRNGHHTRGKGFLDDREKMAEAQAMDWKVLEVAPSGKHPNTLYSPQMLDWLRRVL